MVRKYRPFAIEFGIRQLPGCESADGATNSRDLLRLILDAPSDSPLANVRGVDCQDRLSLLVPESTTAEESAVTRRIALEPSSRVPQGTLALRRSGPIRT